MGNLNLLSMLSGVDQSDNHLICSRQIIPSWRV